MGRFGVERRAFRRGVLQIYLAQTIPGPFVSQADLIAGHRIRKRCDASKSDSASLKWGDVDGGCSELRESYHGLGDNQRETTFRAGRIKESRLAKHAAGAIGWDAGLDYRPSIRVKRGAIRFLADGKLIPIAVR